MYETETLATSASRTAGSDIPKSRIAILQALSELIEQSCDDHHRQRYQEAASSIRGGGPGPAIIVGRDGRTLSVESLLVLKLPGDASDNEPRQIATLLLRALPWVCQRPPQ